MANFDCCCFEYDASAKVFAVHLTGPANDDSLKACYLNAARYVEGREVRGAIINLTDVDSFDVSATGVRALAALEPIVPDPAVRYVIAPQAHIFGMARMFQMVSPKAREKFHVVRTLDAALEALGVTTKQFERLPTLP